MESDVYGAAGVDGGVCSGRAGLLGRSASIQHLRGQFPRVAKAGRTTLLSGPTGCGKEVVARNLHLLSRRAEEPFVTIDCGALPDQIVESELFGHTRGAFTGATEPRSGLVRSAKHGTLFLDEVNSLPLSAQSRLLRLLEHQEYRPVGADRVEHSEAWVIAATNRNLQECVTRGEFRADLLYRLDVIHLEVPPLCERDDDVLLLAQHFLDGVSGGTKSFSECARLAMLSYSWPGNVRELKHRIEAAAILNEGAVLNQAALGLADVNFGESAGGLGARPLERQLWNLVANSGMTLGEAIAFCEQTIIREALREEEQNRTRAAERLGIHVRTIFKKLRRQS